MPRKVSNYLQQIKEEFSLGRELSTKRVVLARRDYTPEEIGDYNRLKDKFYGCRKTNGQIVAGLLGYLIGHYTHFAWSQFELNMFDRRAKQIS